MSERPIGAVVLHHRNWPGIRPTLDALLEQIPAGSDVVVVDNASDDGSVDAIRGAYPTVQVVELDRNGGYGSGMNSGIAALGDPDAVLLLTHDCVLGPGCLAALTGVLRSDPTIGVVGPLIAWRSRPDVVYSAGGVLAGRRMVTHHDGWEQPVADVRGSGVREAPWLEGSCMLARGETLAAVGGFDEHYFLYFEETELCVRARRAGWRLVCETDAIAWQEPGQPSHALWTRNRLRFVLRNLPRRVAAIEVAGRLQEISRHLFTRDPAERRIGRAMVRGLVALPLRSDPARLHGSDTIRAPRASGRAHTA